MDFKEISANAKEKISAYAENTVKNITHICNEFGPAAAAAKTKRTRRSTWASSSKHTPTP